MRVNMTTEYALRMLQTIYFADHKIVTSKVISQKENISNGSAMKILKKLRDNDIVASHQGRGESVGGFSMKANLKEITLYDIILIMKDPIMLLPLKESQHYNITKELQRVNRNLMQDLKKKSLYEIFVGSQN